MPLKTGTWVHTEDYWGVIESRHKVGSRITHYLVRPFLILSDHFEKRYDLDQKGLLRVNRKIFTKNNILHPNIFTLQRWLAYDRVKWYRDKKKPTIFYSSIWQELEIIGHNGKTMRYNEDRRTSDLITIHAFPKDQQALFRILHQPKT